MKFLADEGCDFSVVRALRSAEYDVSSVSELSPHAEDADVIELALREKRILVTEDKDFGQLVYAHSKRTLGVIFLRYPVAARKRLSREVVKLVKERGETLVGCFVVVQPGRIRISPTPGE